MENHMNWGEVETHWEDFKDRIKDKWNKLTDADMKNIHGDRQRLMQALQDRYQLTRDKVEKQVHEFLDSSRSWFEEAKHQIVGAAESGKNYVRENTLVDMTEDLRSVIRKNPMRTALVSLGIGFMMGKLISMGSRA